MKFVATIEGDKYSAEIGVGDTVAEAVSHATHHIWIGTTVSPSATIHIYSVAQDNTTYCCGQYDVTRDDDRFLVNDVRLVKSSIDKLRIEIVEQSLAKQYQRELTESR